jgi:CRISPR/Cas system-associated exonuclease Cas4 (RecB family)
VLPEALQRGLLRVVRSPEAPAGAAPRAPVDPGELAGLEAAVHPDVARLASGARVGLSTVTAPVTQLADAAACPRRYQLLHELRMEEHPDRETAAVDLAGSDPAPASALGTLAHRLLEQATLDLPPARRREELSRALALDGEDPAAHGPVLDAACAFLDSPLAARMARLPPGRLRRELPFTLRLTRAGAPELLVRGQIDALLLEETATVVDYKLSKARDTSRYAAQLDAYALAARELMGAALPVRTGIVFLRSPGAPFVERDPADAAATRDRLLDAATAIAEGRRTSHWPKVAPATCHELSCGFFPRCHGK